MPQLRQLIAPLPENQERIYIDGGRAGTAATIEHMRELVTYGKRAPEIIKLTGDLIQSCTPKDYYDYARQCFNFCQQQIKYAFDPAGVEMLENPVRILENRRADCDSICVLLAAMFESLGFPSRFKTIKADSSRPEEFSHVFVETKIPRKGWITADATMQHPFGWSPGDEYANKTWPASFDNAESHDADEMAGLNMLEDFTFVSQRNVPSESLIASYGPIRYLDTPSINASERSLEEGLQSGRSAWNQYASRSPDFFIPKSVNTLSGFRGLTGLEGGWDDRYLPYIDALMQGRLAQQLKELRNKQDTRAASLKNLLTGYATATDSGSASSRLSINRAISINAKALAATQAAIEAFNRLVKIMQDSKMTGTLPSGVSPLSGMGAVLDASKMLSLGGVQFMLATATLVTTMDDAIRSEKSADDAERQVSKLPSPLATVGIGALLIGLGVGGYFLFRAWRKK